MESEYSKNREIKVKVSSKGQKRKAGEICS